MKKKDKAPPAWRAPFLRALGRTGNVRVAAAEAGVDHGTCYNHRRRDKRFAARWDRVAAKARGRVKDRASTGSARTAQAIADSELILRPSKRCGTQMVRAGKGRWSPKAEKTFLLYLEGTANVRRAAEAAGFSTTALYYRKRRDPAFAARWDEIEGRGTARLNSFLVEAGLASFDPESADEELPKVSVAEAIAIVKLKGGNGQGPARGSRRRGLPEPPIEEVRDEVLRRIAAIRRQREKAAEAAYPSPSSD